MKLLIAEKPSVAKVYKELLEKVENESFTSRDGYFEGKAFTITWCIGHLVGLSSPEAYGWGEWRLDALPMLPDTWKLEALEGTQKQFRTVSTLMKSADTIINGTDAGREGELIYGLVVIQVGCKSKNQQRLWLNSFVMADMVKAWKKLAPAANYDTVFQSAFCRSKADWLVGMNGSRGYSLGTGVRGLSVGRVQTPTLGLIVARDLEIDNWKDRFFFQLTGVWKSLSFTYVKDTDRNFDKPEALEHIKKECEGKSAELRELKRDDRTQNPPKPFDLSNLQKAANQVFGLKAADTLEITQSLYEKKLVTYPRTDSEYLPESMQADSFAILARVATNKEKGVLKTATDSFVFFNSAKVSDHFAIIPTIQCEGAGSLEGHEKQVYELIRSRFVIAFARPYKFEDYQMTLDCHGYAFKARAALERDIGFKTLYAPAKNEDNVDNGETPTNKLTSPPSFAVGVVDILKPVELLKKKASKPTHYTEATLLTAMETAGKAIEDEDMRDAMKERGLGTPATKAAIIEILKKREYISTQGKHLISTIKGRELIKLVDAKLASPEMTGEWEFKLNQMAKGKYKEAEFMQEITVYVKQLTKTYESESASNFENAMTADSLPCPKCKTAKLRENKFGVFCSDKEKCGFAIFAKIAEKTISAKSIHELLTNGKTKVIKGFTKKAGGKFDAALILQDFKVTFDFGSKPATSAATAPSSEPLDLPPCPKCGKKIVQGRFGPGCEDWKGCAFSISNPLAGKVLTPDLIRALILDRKTGKLDGFKSKEQKLFSAALVLTNDFKVKFYF